MRGWFALVIASALLAAGCGSNSPITEIYNPPPAVSVSVAGSTASIEAGQTATFTATVTNSPNQSVTWHVNGKAGGDATWGTIVNGLYTAPPSVTSAMQVTIMVYAHADPTKSATATLNVVPAVTLTIEPQLKTIPAGAVQKFVAKLSNGTTPEVNWTAYAGSMSSDGEFTAPLTTGRVTVQALTLTVPQKQATLEMQVTYSNAILNGTYTFAYEGTKNGGHVAMAGLLTADGKGNITGGIADTNSTGVVERDLSIYGTYATGADGRGTMTLAFPGGVQREWRFAVSTGGYAAFAEFGASTIGSGILIQQSLSGLAGDGFYLLSSSPSPRGPAVAGYIDMETTPNSGAYDVRSGLQPVVHNTFTVSYASENPRRVTIAVKDSAGTHEYRAYVISMSEFYAVSLDAGYDVVLRGMHTTRGSFGTPAEMYKYVLSGAGTTATGATAIAGGDLVLNEGVLKSGTLDLNAGGAVTSWNATSGSYTSGTIRGEMHIPMAAGTLDLVLYAAGDKAAFITSGGTPQAAGWIETQPFGWFGAEPECPCYTSSALYALNAAAPSIVVGHIAPGDTAEGSNVVDALQAGATTLDAAVLSNLEAASAGSRRVLTISGPVARTYAVYSCRAVSLDAQRPEGGVLLADAPVLWPIYY